MGDVLFSGPLSQIMIILFVGLLVGIVTSQFKIPAFLFLIFVGLCLSYVTLDNGERFFSIIEAPAIVNEDSKVPETQIQNIDPNSENLIEQQSAEDPPDTNIENSASSPSKKNTETDAQFVITTVTLTLALIVFQGGSKITLKELSTYTEKSIEISLAFLATNLIFLGIATFGFIYFLLVFLEGHSLDIMSLVTFVLCIIFATVMSGTSPVTLFSIFKDKSHKVIELLKFESIVNTPIIVIVPYIVVKTLIEVPSESSTINNISVYVYPFLMQIAIAIGMGFVISLLVFRFMERTYYEKYSALIMVTAILLTYIVTEQMGGNGVLAVTILGVLFGRWEIKRKYELQEFSNMLSNILEVFVFILIAKLRPSKFHFKHNCVLYWFVTIICINAFIKKNRNRFRIQKFQSIKQRKNFHDIKLCKRFICRCYCTHF